MHFKDERALFPPVAGGRATLIRVLQTADGRSVRAGHFQHSARVTWAARIGCALDRGFLPWTRRLFWLSQSLQDRAYFLVRRRGYTSAQRRYSRFPQPGLPAAQKVSLDATKKGRAFDMTCRVFRAACVVTDFSDRELVFLGVRAEFFTSSSYGAEWTRVPAGERSGLASCTRTAYSAVWLCCWLAPSCGQSHRQTADLAAVYHLSNSESRDAS